MSKDVIIDLAKLRNYEINGEAYFALDDVVKSLNITEADLERYKNEFPEYFSNTEGIEVVKAGLEEIMLLDGTCNAEADEEHQVTIYIRNKGLLYNLDEILKLFGLTEADISVLKDALPKCFITLKENAVKTINHEGLDYLCKFASTERKPEEFQEWFKTKNPNAELEAAFQEIFENNPELYEPDPDYLEQIFNDGQE